MEPLSCKSASLVLAILCLFAMEVHPAVALVTTPEGCPHPCQCPVRRLDCMEGVSIVKDGCGCCYMCARQRGDLCNVRDKCDTDLYCQMSNNQTGICQGKVRKPCVVEGVTYQDGQQFKPDCRRHCTCQNGFYGCVSLCPQEDQRPSRVSCFEPRLMEVPGQCCKEWTCESPSPRSQRLTLRHSPLGLESQNLVMQRPPWEPATTTPRPTTPAPCHVITTDWSPCSVSCDVGMSVRVVQHATECRAVEERRLCFLRPCGREVSTLGRSKCTPTTRSGRKYHIRFQDCISVKEYNLKFCTTCKRKRCCYPHKERTRFVELQCTGGHREVMNFMWIKKCRCDRKCYQKDDPNKKPWRRFYG